MIETCYSCFIERHHLTKCVKCKHNYCKECLLIINTKYVCKGCADVFIEDKKRGYDSKLDFNYGVI